MMIEKWLRSIRLHFSKGMFWDMERCYPPSLVPWKQVKGNLAQVLVYFVRLWCLALGSREDCLQRAFKLGTSAAVSLVLFPWDLESAGLGLEGHHPWGIPWKVWEDDLWRIRGSPKREEVCIAVGEFHLCLRNLIRSVHSSPEVEELVFFRLH